MNELAEDTALRLELVDSHMVIIHSMPATKQNKQPTKKLKGKSLEQYVIDTYINLVQIAKEQGIKLPR